MKHLITLGYILASLTPLWFIIGVMGTIFIYSILSDTRFGENHNFGEYAKHILTESHIRENNFLTRGYDDTRYTIAPAFADSVFARLTQYCNDYSDKERHCRIYAEVAQRFGDTVDTGCVHFKVHFERWLPYYSLYAYNPRAAVIYVTHVPDGEK